MLTNHLFKYKGNAQEQDFDRIWDEARSNSVEYLDLSRCAFRHVNFPNKPLPNLKVLDISYNTAEIEAMMIPTDKFPALEHLYLYNSKIKKLDIKGEWRVPLQSINIAKNPLENIPQEIIGQGTEALNHYWKELHSSSTLDIGDYINRQLKVIMAGNSTSGKSSVFDFLAGKEYNGKSESTHWLEIKEIEACFKKNGNDINLLVFDLGGQDYYHDTHSIYFSPQTLYLLLWDKKTNKDPKFGEQTFPIAYWLEAIKLFSEENNRTRDFYTEKRAFIEGEEVMEAVEEFMTPFTEKVPKKETDKPETASPIILIQNKTDLDGKSWLNAEGLTAEYPGIREFLSVSIEKGNKTDSIRKAIQEVIDDMPAIGGTYSGIYEHRIEAVKEYAEEKPLVISVAEFNRLCNEAVEAAYPNKSLSGLILAGDDTIFLTFMRNRGDVLYFPDDAELKDKVFMRIDKVSEYVYEILEKTKGSSGSLTQKMIYQAVGKTTFDRQCEDLVLLMEKFKVIFEMPDTEKYIAPQYLPAEPDDISKLFLDTFEQHFYTIEYKKYIHKGIVLDFFAQYGKEVLKDKELRYFFWRDGLVVRNPNLHQEILLIRFEGFRKIEISALRKQGITPFVQEVFDFLRKLGSRYETEVLVTPYSKTDFVPLEILKKYEREKQYTFVYNGKPFQLSDFKKHLTESNFPLKKIFVSYSQQDAQHKENLLKHLAVLQRQGMIEAWSDSDLHVGEEWDESIQEKLKAADIVFFLISSDFLATKYIWDVEVKIALEREENEKGKSDGIIIFPIVLRSCDWQETALSKFNAASKAVPLMITSDHDTFWHEKVVKKLRELLVKKV